MLNPDLNALDSDWTKAYRLDLPGADAASVARWLWDNDRPIEWLTGKPNYERWLVGQPWLADVGVELDGLARAARRDAAAMKKASR